MTTTTEPTKRREATPKVTLGELQPVKGQMHTNMLGEPNIAELLPRPTPELVAALLPTHRAAADELAALRADADTKARAYAELNSPENEAEDRRRSTYGEDFTAIDTRPVRLREARLAASTAAALYWAGLFRWGELVGQVDLGAELRNRAAELDCLDALAHLDALRPTIEALDQLYAVRAWLDPQSEAVRNITAAPDRALTGQLLASFDELRYALEVATASQPAPA